MIGRRKVLKKIRNLQRNRKTRHKERVEEYFHKIDKNNRSMKDKELLETLCKRRKQIVHKLTRCRRKIEIMSSKYNDKERQFTFHGGFDYGYEKGRVSILEDQLDDLNADIEALSRL